MRIKYLDSEPSLDPPEEASLLFTCDNCKETVSDEHIRVRDGDLCPFCLWEEEIGIMRLYEHWDLDIN